MHNWDLFSTQDLWSATISSGLSPSLNKAASKCIFMAKLAVGRETVGDGTSLSSQFPRAGFAKSKRGEMPLSDLLPVLVLSTCYTLFLLLFWTFGCLWIFLRRARRAQPVEWLSQLQAIASFLLKGEGECWQWQVSNVRRFDPFVCCLWITAWYLF